MESSLDACTSPIVGRRPRKATRTAAASPASRAPGRPLVARTTRPARSTRRASSYPSSSEALRSRVRMSAAIPGWRHASHRATARTKNGSSWRTAASPSDLVRQATIWSTLACATARRLALATCWRYCRWARWEPRATRPRQGQSSPTAERGQQSSGAGGSSARSPAAGDRPNVPARGIAQYRATRPAHRGPPRVLHRMAPEEGTRTPDPPVNSRLLYRLSYSGPCSPEC